MNVGMNLYHSNRRCHEVRKIAQLHMFEGARSKWFPTQTTEITCRTPPPGQHVERH